MTDLASEVAMVTRRLTDLLDTRLPGQLEALYLVGSVALGDYRPGQSDVDFVAVLADPPADHASALADIHAALARDCPAIDCDGIYLRVGELSVAPAGHGVEARAGKIDPHSAAERHPVTWLILAEAGIALRGRAPSPGWIAADPLAAAAYSRDNLERYWRPWLEARRSLLSRQGLSLLSSDTVVWGCLGLARLAATIATGSVPSKSGAGEWARKAFPQHARILDESLRLRQGESSASSYRSPLTRKRDLIAFMQAVLARP